MVRIASSCSARLSWLPMLHTKHSMCDPLLVQVNALGAGLLLGSALVIILPEGMLLDHQHTLRV
jgi:hypothetical protein